MDLKEAIKKRHSVRKFLSKKPDWRKIIRSIDAARYAPAAGNQFVTKFLLIQDEKKIQEISKACQQEFVGTAKAIVVVATNDSRIESLYKEKGKRYAAQQAGAAIQNFLLELTEQGLVTAWVGHFREEEVKKICGIKKETIDAILPIGLETKIKTKERLDKELENIIYFDQWGNKKMEPEAFVSSESF